MSPTNELGGWWRTGAMVVLLTLLPVATLAGEAVIERASGHVELGRGDPPAWRPAGEGDALAAGDRLRTGRDGRAELAFQGATIRLYGDSLLRLPRDPWEAATGVELDGGAGLFDVQHREHDRFEVHTPDVVVSVKGTRFGVDLGGDAPAVAVYRGTVGVRALALEGAHEVMVREGFRAVGGAEGPAELFLLDRRDPWDDWMVKGMGPTARATNAPPARRADAAAERSARLAARDRAIDLALKRDPKLADRLATMRSELKAAAGSVPDADAVAPLARLDPVLDSTSAAVDETLKSRFLERVLNGSGNDFGVSLSSLGTIQIQQTSGGQSWQLDQDSLVAILDGSASLPQEIDDAIQATGVTNSTELVVMMLGLLGP